MDGSKKMSLKSQASLAVLASGKGSNLSALINAINSGNIANANIALVISNKKD